jgi:hypothetical protein
VHPIYFIPKFYPLIFNVQLFILEINKINCTLNKNIIGFDKKPLTNIIRQGLGQEYVIQQEVLEINL